MNMSIYVSQQIMFKALMSVNGNVIDVHSSNLDTLCNCMIKRFLLLPGENKMIMRKWTEAKKEKPKTQKKTKHTGFHAGEKIFSLYMHLYLFTCLVLQIPKINVVEIRRT